MDVVTTLYVFKHKLYQKFIIILMQENNNNNDRSFTYCIISLPKLSSLSSATRTVYNSIWPALINELPRANYSLLND